jgi:hypothetical protein
MDRIILVVAANGQTVNRLYIQSDAGRGEGVSAEYGELNEDARTAYGLLVSALTEQYGERFNPPAVSYLVEHPISASPTDPPLERVAFANLPQETGPASFAIPVLIKHYAAGVYVPEQRADITEVLRSDNTMIIEIDGQPRKEYEYFKELARAAPLPAIIAGQIERMDALGRFNNQY